MGKMKQHAHATLMNSNNKNFRRRNRRTAVGWQRVEVTIEEDGNDDVVIVVERHNQSSPVFILDRPEHPMWKIFAKNKARLGTMLVQCVLLLVLIAFLGHRTFSWYMRHRIWVPAPILFLQRTCPAVPYETIRTTATTMPTICITTLTDNPTTAKKSSTVQKLLRWRNFDNVLDLTWKNKAAYAAKYGYHLVDSSFLLDTTRPPAWSKIRAVQHLLGSSSMKTSGDTSNNNSTSLSSSSLLHCDWVLWMDADTVIMNSNIRITDFLPTPSAHDNNNTDSPIDWVIASDKGGGYNSGVFLVRNVPWSHRLLEEWWNMKEYVRPPGLALSGDNAALKALLARKMNDPLEAVHFAVPPRCTMNSFAKFVSWRESEQLRLGGRPVLKTKDWYMDTEHYHKGDFIAHTPGIDNKAECLKLLLQEAQ